MQLGYDVRYLRWLVRVLSASMPTTVPGLDRLLLGLLRQRKETVVAALTALGVDLPGLLAATERTARSRAFATYYEHWQEYQAIFAGPACQEAARMGCDRVHSEHLLLALASAPGSLKQLLREHGMTVDRLRQVLKGSEWQSPQDDLAWRDKLVRQGWHLAMTADSQAELQFAEARHPADGYPIHPYRIGTMADELREAGDFRLLGHLYEALGATNQLLFAAHAMNGQHYSYFPAQQWTIGAHFYRLAGDRSLAASVSQRAMDQLNERLGGPEASGEYGIYQVPYLRELLADATVCIDSEQADLRYQEALTAFSRLDEHERCAQQGEGAEEFGWGGFHTEQAAHFLPGDPRDIRDEACSRIALKRQVWIGQ